MKKSIISSGALALALALFTTGCSWFESSGPASQDGFYRPLNHAGKNSSNRNPGDADLNGFGNGGLSSATHPSDYADGSGLAGNPYGDFGTPIPGVVFNPVYFGFDQFNVNTSEQSKIDAVITYLSSNAGTGVVIEGNCDIRGSEEYNRALGERRALAAQEQILGAGIAPNRVKTISNGKSKLAAIGTDEESHRLNRRDEFVVVKLLGH